MVMMNGNFSFHQKVLNFTTSALANITNSLENPNYFQLTTPTTFNQSLSILEYQNVTTNMPSNDLLSSIGTTNLYNEYVTNGSIQMFNYCPYVKSPISNLILLILYSTVCLVGLFGNTLVIFVVLRFSKMQTVTNMYILNLAIADECFLIGIPFLITTMQLGEWVFGNMLCKFYMVSTSITQFTSSIFLLIMSADRYIAVCHPISSPRFRTPFVSRLVSIFAWVCSFLLMLPVMLYSNTIGKFSADDEKRSCIIKWPQKSSDEILELHKTNSTLSGFEDDDSDGRTFIWYSLILGFALPLSLILIFYYLVIRKLKTVGPKNKSKEKRRSHRKVTQLVLTVITVYVLCWTPYWVSQMALISTPADHCKTKLEIAVFVLVGCLVYSNSAMNPVLYAFLSDNFKKSFMKAFTCTNGTDLNILHTEYSFFPKFGRNRAGSERLYASTITKLNRLDNKNGNGMDNVTTALINNNNDNRNGAVTATTLTTTSTSLLSERQGKVLHTDL